MSWASITLEQATAKFISGGTPSTSDQSLWSGDLPWVTGADFDENTVRLGRRYINEAAVDCSATNIVPKGAVLLVTRTGVGKNAIAPTDIAISQDITGIVPFPAFDANFVRYAIKHNHSSLIAAQRGATIKGVTRDTIKKLPIPFISLREQSRIVELLSEADRLCLLCREADAKTAHIIPALFLKMFGDPATNPKGWPTDRVDILFDIFGGGTPSKAVGDYWEGDIPWVSPKDMKSAVIRDTEDHITNAAIANSATKLVESGSILIVYRSSILAHTFPIAFAGCSLTINQDLKALTSRGEVSNEFLYGFLAAGQKLALSCVKKGATVQNIDGPRFLSLQVPKPPAALQNQFATNLKCLLALKEKLEHSSNKIDDMFSLLLQKAFSGQLTAKWREANMMELLSEMEQHARALNLPIPKEIEAFS